MRSRSQLIQPTRSLAGSGWSRSMISSATRGAPAEAMPLTVARFASGGGAEVAAGAAGLVTAAGSVMVEGAGTGLAAEAGAAGVPAAVATAVEAAGVAARFLEALG